MKCIHCSQRLEGDEIEVCRFCKPKFSARRGVGGLYPARCRACEEGRAHEPQDLVEARERLSVG